MKYKIDKKHYKTFETFGVNKLPYRAYFVPFSDEKKLLSSSPLDERYQSDKITLLNGEWDFSYYSKVSNLPDNFDTDKIQFNKENNPFCWQRRGYENPVYLNSRYPIKGTPPEFPTDCPVGVYRKIFNKEIIASNELLTFLGVAGGGYCVYLNSIFVGYHEGSHNSGEWDITNALKLGENELVVVLFKWSAATYIECQDMFRENGIFRDCYITSHNSSYIYDYQIDYKKTDKGYKCNFNYVIGGNKDATVSIILKDGDKVLFEGSQSGEKAIEFNLTDIKEWTAEKPKLYTAYISLALNNRVECEKIEYIRQLIGFKTIKIVGNVFYFNDKPIKLLGVNHHDSNCKNGFVMSNDDYLTDILLMKKYNVNCVRTSHYPPDPIMLTMCDIYGLYCIDEADIEAHGCQMTLHRKNLISNDLRWKNHMLDRVKAMFMRDRNHTSITMWSLGNESGGIKCQIECNKYLKTVTDIPVHYEPAFRFKIKHFDVYSRMYHPINPMRKVAALKSNKRLYEVPYFQCEYAHAMGVGPGGLNEYVKTFFTAKHILGGCIWEWIDHAVEHKDGAYKYTYGGDHNEELHDGNFCCDGLFFPDHTPSSGALCMKNSYRPVVANFENAKISLLNRRYWQNTSDMTITVEVLRDGNVTYKEIVSKIVEPQKSITLDLDLSPNNNDLWVRVTYTSLDNEEIAQESIEIARKVEISQPIKSTITADGNGYIAKGADFEAQFDSKGDLVSYIYKGNNIINSPIRLEYAIWRPFVDNYRVLQIFWKLLGYEKAKYKIKKVSIVDNKLCVKAIMKMTLQKIIINIVYAVDDNGQIVVTNKVKSNSIFPTDFPKMGIKFAMDKSYSNVKYYGLGDGENYSDFDTQSNIGIYNQTTDDFFENYIRPQDNGNRSQVRWFELTDEKGCGIKATALNQPFNFKVDTIDEQSVNDGNHIEDVKQSNTSNVYINGYVRGIGSQSCGMNDTEKKYKKMLFIGKSYTFSYAITPIIKKD